MSADYPPGAEPPQHALPTATLLAAGDAPLDLETITDAIDAGRPLPEILDLVVERAYLLLGAGETFIMLREGDRLVCAAERGLDNAVPLQLQVDEGIEGWVATHRRPLIMPDAHRDPRFRNFPQRQHAIASIISLPLQARGQVLGVLSAATVETTDFAGDLLLLLVLADLATLAIQGSRSLAREVRRSRLVDLLRFVSNVDYSPPLPTAFGPIADRVAEVVGAEKVDIMFFDAERDALVSLGVSSTPLGQRQKELGLDIIPCSVSSLLAEAFQSGQSLLSGDLRRDPHAYRPLVEELGIRSEMASVLQVAGDQRGLLLCTSTRVDAFTEDDLAVQDLIARRLSLALQHVELTEDLTRLETERLERLERDAFFELLAHDVKNPLAAIKGYAQLAQRRLHKGDIAYVERALRVVDEKTAQLERLLNEMLEVSRLTRGAFTIQRQAFDLAALLRDECEAAQTTTTRHTVVLDAPDRFVL